MAKKLTPETPEQRPQSGGSYVRDPATGELKRQAHTKARPAKQKNQPAKEGTE